MKILRFFACVFTIVPRFKLQKSIRKMESVSEAALQTFKKEIARAQENGTKSFEKLNRIAIYFSILYMDLSVLRAHLLLEFDGLCKNVFARQVALIIYEYLYDQPNLLDEEFRVIISNLPKSEQHIEKAKENGRLLRIIRKKYANLLIEIRNNVVAHRDHDGEKQLQIIENIDMNMMKNLSKKIYFAIDNDIQLLKTIAEDYAYSRLELKEISKHIEQANSSDK